MFLRKISTSDELLTLIEEIGFLPFFRNEIPGFSIEDCIESELWFASDADDPWEWKGSIARSGRCV